MPSTPPADLAFSARWIIDEYPACPKGLVFLRQLSEESPRLYTIAEQYGFCDPSDAELKVHPLWLAFVDHYAGCDDCNEA